MENSKDICCFWVRTLLTRYAEQIFYQFLNLRASQDLTEMLHEFGLGLPLLEHLMQDIDVEIRWTQKPADWPSNWFFKKDNLAVQLFTTRTCEIPLTYAVGSGDGWFRRVDIFWELKAIDGLASSFNLNDVANFNTAMYLYSSGEIRLIYRAVAGNNLFFSEGISILNPSNKSDVFKKTLLCLDGKSRTILKSVDPLLFTEYSLRILRTSIRDWLCELYGPEGNSSNG